MNNINKSNAKRALKEIEPILPEIKKILQKIYADRLVDVFLYGSFAKNKAGKDSDIDIAVVLKYKVDQSKEIDKTCDALYELMLRTGELISVFPVSSKEIRTSNWPLYHHITIEGKKL